MIAEAGKFATEAIAPLDVVGDREGARCDNGVVTTPTGFRDAYRRWAEAGWAGVTATPEYGGMGLPHAVAAACNEMWSGASMGFALCPLLGEGAIGALEAYGGDALRATYLGRLVSGEWTGTMNLTEPQAGSDLSAVKTRAERAPDGTYRLTGQKIFITYGEHDMADNIVHLVLARLPDAPPGTRGISLFLAPKFLVKPDGSLGPPQRRALRLDRAQARHPRLADLRHGLRRRRRGDRLAGRRGEPRPGGDVRDDERRPARRRPAGRGDRREGLSAGAGLRARAPPGPRRRRRHEPDHRASRRPAHAGDDEGARPGGARHLPSDRDGDRPGAHAPTAPRRAPRRASAPRC